MNLSRARHHLAAAGITDAVLHATGIDPNNPAAVRAEVETLLRSVLAEGQILCSGHDLTRLQLALSNLLTPAERASNEILAMALHRDLTTAGVLVPVPRGPESCPAGSLPG